MTKNSLPGGTNEKLNHLHHVGTAAHLGFVEILAAYLIFRYNRIETALRINSL